MKKQISKLFPGNFQAVPMAKHIRFYNVTYNVLPVNYGGAFVKVQINDPRYVSETLVVAAQTLYSFC